MVDVQDTSIFKKISEDLKVPSQELPRKLVSNIQPVFDVGPERYSKSLGFKADTSTGGTIFTSSTVKRTFITGLQISIQKDVTSTVTDASIRATIGGAIKRIAQLTFLSLTIAQDNLYIEFKNPIEVDKGTNVTTTINGGGVANHSMSTIVFGYEVEPQ